MLEFCRERGLEVIRGSLAQCVFVRARRKSKIFERSSLSYPPIPMRLIVVIPPLQIFATRCEGSVEIFEFNVRITEDTIKTSPMVFIGREVFGWQIELNTTATLR